MNNIQKLRDGLLEICSDGIEPFYNSKLNTYYRLNRVSSRHHSKCIEILQDYTQMFAMLGIRDRSDNSLWITNTTELLIVLEDMADESKDTLHRLITGFSVLQYIDHKASDLLPVFIATEIIHRVPSGLYMIISPFDIKQEMIDDLRKLLEAVEDL